MPEFILDTGTPENHAWFDALPAFTQGAVEAALFIAPPIYWQAGDPPEFDESETVELIEAGLDHLTDSARAVLAAAAGRFYLANLDHIREACAGGEYDEKQAGRDFWFTGTGCGTGYSDRGDSEALDALETAARYVCEDLLFADFREGKAPDTRAGLNAADLGPESVQIDSLYPPEPLDLVEFAAARAASRGLDVGNDMTAWRAAVATYEAAQGKIREHMEREHAAGAWCDVPPRLSKARATALTALESIEARLLDLDADSKPGPLADVGTRYGAPMGRPSDRLDGLRAVVVPVTLDAGGYDAGGAYWGRGVPLWRARAIQAAGQAFARAESYRSAVIAFKESNPRIEIDGEESN